MSRVVGQASVLFFGGGCGGITTAERTSIFHHSDHVLYRVFSFWIYNVVMTGLVRKTAVLIMLCFVVCMCVCVFLLLLLLLFVCLFVWFFFCCCFLFLRVNIFKGVHDYV